MQTIQAYRGRRLPRPARLAGYSLLISAFDLNLPLPFELHAVADRNAKEKAEGWIVHPASRWPGDEPVDHVLFALKNEPLALRVLSAVFARMAPTTLVSALRDKPGGRFVRRACFLYEWLTGETLPDIPQVTGPVADAVDPRLQFGLAEEVGPAAPSTRRFRVRDNLPGTVAFCPLIARTHRLDELVERDLRADAEKVLAARPPEMIRRASAYLLLKDSRSSFSIEDETPSPDRMQRWATAIGQAGSQPLTVQLLLDLQRQVIGESVMTQLGLRQEGGFVGYHDALGQPRPDHIDARHEDVPALLDGMIAFERRAAAGGYHAVLTAASLAFGFVYAHPFEDGNGRLHRWLIHHVLADRRYAPPGIIFPVSAAIEADVLRYRETLESVSRTMLPHIEWQSTTDGNVRVTNETAPLYRYFNATRNAEFLFTCIVQTIEHDLVDELDFLEIRDGFHRRGTQIVDMPERRLDALFHILKQNGGRLSKTKREGIFAKLTDAQASAFEALYTDITAQTAKGSAEAEPSLFD